MIKIKNIAKALQKIYTKRTDNFDRIDFIRLCNQHGTYEIECPESCDSSRLYTFTDGSKARMDNPHEEAFEFYFCALK